MSARYLGETYQPPYVVIEQDEQLNDLGWFPPAEKAALLTELAVELEDLYAQNQSLFTRGMANFFRTVSSHIRSSRGITTRATMERVNDDLAKLADYVVSYFHRRVPEVLLDSGEIDQNRQCRLAQKYAKILFEEIISQKPHLFSKFFTANVKVSGGELALAATGSIRPHGGINSGHVSEYPEIPFD